MEDSSLAVRVQGRTNRTEVRNKFDCGDDEKQEGGRGFSHRTPEKVSDQRGLLDSVVDAFHSDGDGDEEVGAEWGEEGEGRG